MAAVRSRFARSAIGVRRHCNALLQQLRSVDIDVNVTNMKYANEHQPVEKRAYRQGARAKAAAQTERSVVQVFLGRLEKVAFDQITLDSVATAAGVTVQTIIRRFASKEGLLQAAAESLGTDIQRRRAAPQDDTVASIKALVGDYEITGDLTIRLLAQEHHSAVRNVLTLGRRSHREWVRNTFGSVLHPLPRAARDRRLAGLIVLTDVYTWKLLRRDQGLAPAATAAVILGLIEASTRAAHEVPAAPKDRSINAC